MSATALAETSCAETYDNVKGLLIRMCQFFVGRHGGEFDNYFSVSNEAYLRAYKTYNSSYGIKFTTWLWNCVQNALLDELRKKKRLKVVRLMYDTYIASQKIDESLLEFDYFTRGLSKDASKVIELISDTPSELAELLGVGTKSTLRGILRDYLHGIGWSMGQITEAFSEVKDFVRR